MLTIDSYTYNQSTYIWINSTPRNWTLYWAIFRHIKLHYILSAIILCVYPSHLKTYEVNFWICIIIIFCVFFSFFLLLLLFIFFTEYITLLLYIFTDCNLLIIRCFFSFSFFIIIFYKTLFGLLLFSFIFFSFFIRKKKQKIIFLNRLPVD